MHIVILKQKQDNYNNNFKESTVKMFQTVMLIILTNDNLKKLRNSNIKNMLIFQIMIATALITDNIASVRTDILTLIIYREVVKDLV